MTAQDLDWLPRSPDDSDEGWGDHPEGSSQAEQVDRRLDWFRRERPPHASE